MAHLTSLTAAVALALAVPAAAVLATAGPAAAGTPTELVSPATTTVPERGGVEAAHPTGPAVVVAPARRVLGELDPSGDVPLRHGDLRISGPALGGGPAGGPDSLSAGPWCNVQCITSGVAYQHGDGVELVVHTSVPAQVMIAAWIDEDGDFVPEPGTYQSANSGALVTEFSWVPVGLAPGETYYGAVAATDAYGNTSTAWGTFTVPS